MGDKEQDALFKEIEEEIGKTSSGARKTFLLIFRARNPEELKKFHSKCDGKGPTLTILYGRYNVMFGGYTSKDWIGCTRKQIEDRNAFLFYKRESGDTKCMIYPILDGSKHKAITCDVDLGPTFGGGDYYGQQYDLLSFSLKSKGLDMIDDFMRLNGHVNFNGYCYKREGGDIKPTDINGGKMDVKMIEVYQVVAMGDKEQDALFKEIEEEIGKTSSGARKTFLLIFRARNPEELKKFHSKCDGKGPTLTILYGRYNVMFGGYTSKDWIGCTRKQIEDRNAFLFYKRESGDTKCMIYPILDGSKHKAITCDVDLGPTFGGGDYYGQQYDLLSFSLKSKGLDMIDEFMRLNGHVNFNGYCYKREGGDIKPTDMNGGKMDVKMIEVYQVVDNALKTQWRKKPEDEEYKRMKNYLLNFKPQHGLQIPSCNILLVGVIGSGKSSFYNTLATVFAGEVKEPAPTANEASKSITNEVHAYEITTKEGKLLALKFYDIRGFDETRAYDHELEHLLDGRLPKNYVFPDESQPVNADSLLENPELKDKIHLVCFIADITKFEIQQENDALAKSLDDIKVIIRRKGLHIMAVVTKMDQLCPRIAEDAENIYTSPKALSAVENAANMLGLPEKYVFPIVNYFNDRVTSTAKDRLAVEALYGMVRSAESYLEQHPELQKEDPLQEFYTHLAHVEAKGNHQSIKEAVQTEIAQLGEKSLRVLCVGAVNAGKSCFIDSMNSAIAGSITSKASGGITLQMTDDSGNVIPTTEKFQLFPLRYKPSSGEGKTNVMFGDMPGFQHKGVGIEQIKMIINGHVPNKVKVHSRFNKDYKTFVKAPEKGDKTHVVCIVFDICTVETMPKETRTMYMKLTRWLIKKNIPYIVVITKSDELSMAVADNTLELVQDKLVCEKKNALVRMFGFKENKVFPVRNYIHQKRVVPEMDALLFDAFLEVLKLGKQHLEDMEDASDSSEEDGNEEVVHTNTTN